MKNQISMFPAIPTLGQRSQGNTYFVRPSSGDDTHGGKKPFDAFKTLAKALSVATANQNDVVYLMSEGNASAATTDYQSTTLNWNKDGVHLIGVGAPTAYSNRARVALISTYVTASNLFTLSANNCIISNVSFFEGVASALPTGCMKVTGSRNVIENCHIAGMGNAANVISGAYSLNLCGSENLFKECTIGIDTVNRGAVSGTAELILGGASEVPAVAAARNTFKDCMFVTASSSATNNVFVLATGADCIDRILRFDNCTFFNSVLVAAGSIAITYGLTVGAAASIGGTVVAKNCTGVGITDWTDNSGNFWVDGGAPAAATSGLAVLATK